MKCDLMLGFLMNVLLLQSCASFNVRSSTFQYNANILTNPNGYLTSLLSSSLDDIGDNSTSIDEDIDAFVGTIDSAANDLNYI